MNGIWIALKRVCMLGAMSVLLLSTARANPTEWPWKDAAPPPGTKINYIQPNAALMPIKPLKGKKYEDLVPDTPDLAEMSSLAINALTCNTNRLQDYEQYFSVYLGNPLRMAHNFSDWCTPKYMEALTLLRAVTGSEYMTQVDQTWQDQILKSIGPDGLFYFPIRGKPWYGKELWWANGIARADGSITVPGKPDPNKLKELDTYAQAYANSVIEESGITQFTHPAPAGRMIEVLDTYYQRDGNPRWKDMIKRMADRMDGLAIRKDDYAFYPAYLYEPGAKFDPKDPKAAMPMGLVGGEIGGRFIRAAAIAYELTGDKKALELSRRLANYMRFRADYFGPAGEFGGEHHFHAHTNYMLGIMEYAVAAHDREMLDFVRKSFEWAKSPASGFGPVSGFVPEFADPGQSTSEGCAVGDMVGWGAKLSAYGVGDYYEDVERWTRNYFTEIQLTSAKAGNMVRHGQSMKPHKLLYNETDDHVAERNVGSFSSWAKGNEWWGGYRDTDNLLMQCCTGNCTRALFWVWRNILDCKNGELKINMLLNRASPWADVYSFIPYQGRVEIKMKQSCAEVLVHAPEWIATGSGEIKVSVNGTPRIFSWQARYLKLGKVKKGRTVSIEFPIGEKTVKEKMGKETYTLLVRGNTVVGIDPPGKICPLFQREYMRDSRPRWRKVQRFVTDKTIDY